MNRPDLRAKLAAYLSLREALDMPIQNRSMLSDFVEHLERRNQIDPIRAHYVLDWICGTLQPKGVSTQYARFHLAKAFLKYLKATMPEIEIPDRKTIRKPSRPKPFVFTDHQLNSFLIAASELEATRTSSTDPFVAYTMFALMACTGLRNGEARKLKIEDVHLNHPARLFIRDAKFGKCRWVPIHSTTAQALRRYLNWRRSKLPGAEFVFATRKGASIHYLALRNYFLRCIQRGKIDEKPGESRPSLHSLRHTFAVRRLTSWYAESADLSVLMPALSVYLGHCNPAASYWYLSGTPELMTEALQLFENFANMEVRNEE